MKNNLSLLFTLLLAGWHSAPAWAQTGDSDNPACRITAQPVTDRIVPFKLSEPGIVRDVEWGADEAWMHEQNLRRCVLFMGKDNVSIVRVSFQPTYPLVNGDLQEAQKTDLEERLRLLGFTKKDVKLTLNCDHPSVDTWYKQNAENWAQLIDVTAKYFQDAGYEIVSVSPFNEPDYGWNQWVPGSQDSYESTRMIGFKKVATELRKNERFDNIRICGGNTLSCDRALPWYNYLKDYLDEGNTHQLAGTFDSFAGFYSTLRDAGKHATADEMHNVMEAMVGLEYGLQTGIWWGPAEYARGEFCKASHGERLGYAEHRDNWTAASVYRGPDGKVQAFGGTSERQGVTTTYRFVSKDRDVFYNGHGPQREFVMELPGGTGYQTGQTNAEQVVNITWGEDVPPVIDGTYFIVNKSNKRLLKVADDNLSLASYLVDTKLQWNVKPVDPRIGGDFSYHYLTSVSSSQALDVLNWSLEDGADVIPYTKNNNANQQWYLEYAGDNWFYIRNRHSSLCLEATSNSSIQQKEPDGNDKQLWRFCTVGIAPRFTTIPAAPDGVTAKAAASSVQLTWAPAAATTSTFTVLRSETAGGSYDIIARNLKDTTFTDNQAEAEHTYYYIVKTVDKCFNTSAASAEVSARPTGENNLIARYEFEENTNDTTVNKNHGGTLAAASFNEGKNDKAIVLNGSSSFVQLPATIANHRQITIATWMYWQGGSTWQRIFDFGNGEDEYMFLTPSGGTSKLRFAIKNGGDEQYLDSESSLSGQLNTWIHVAVTLGENGVCLYQDGKLVASSEGITLRPTDFRPVMNYIGRSQFTADPMFKGRIDDFRVYNYALTAEQIQALTDGTANGIETAVRNDGKLHISPLPADRAIEVTFGSDDDAHTDFIVYDAQGRPVRSARAQQGMKASISTAGLPEGVYILKAVHGEEYCTRKFTVRH